MDQEHLVPNNITEFYNKCHDEEGKFCSEKGPGATGDSISGKTSLRDNDGQSQISKEPVKRGRLGGSLEDPHEGTDTIDGIRGYNPESGKPVPGTDAWLESHGISRTIFNKRPYIKYEADRQDAALIEGYKEYPRAQKFFLERAEQEGQGGGYLMYKTEVPGSPWGPIAPQARPNNSVVTNAAKRAYAEKVLQNDIERLAVLKKTTPADLRSERRAQLKKAELNLQRAKTATPEKVRAEAEKNLSKAKEALTKAKAKNDPVAILEAKQNLTVEKRQHEKDNKRANNWRADKELYDAEIAVTHAKNRLQKSIENPKAALDSEIKRQQNTVKRSENRFEKTAAKYVFPPGTSSARIDMNPDPQNIKNLTQGKGRIYFAMEGSIKGDSILNSLKKEDPTATVVNVPSVTLWQQRGSLPGVETAGEVSWFTKKYGKGREIVLIPDADGINNPNVMLQAKALSTVLHNSGAGRVILATPPLKYGTKKQEDKFILPSGIIEKRKGVDDHLGAGRGQLGQLQYTSTIKVPKYDLSEYTGKPGKSEPKMNRNAVERTEKVLAAISGIAGPEGVTKLPKKALAQTANLPLSSTYEARDRLVRLGIIKVEHIFDEQALSRGKLIRNPKVSEDRVDELVRQKIIKQPNVEYPYTDKDIDYSPVVTILDKRFVIKQKDIRTGTLSDISTWNPPKNFKGWTSSVNGQPDKTGIAVKLETETAKRIAKNEARKAAEKEAARALTAKQRLAKKKAPPGRRLVRSEAGAKRYGVPVGGLIPLAESDIKIVSVVDSLPGDILSMMPVELYNQCHGPDGKFCETPGGTREKVSGKLKSDDGFDSRGWPASKGRTIKTVDKTKLGSITVDGIKAKAVYEITTNNGKKIKLYDKTGKAGDFKDELLQNHARMNEMYPLRPPRSIIVTRPGGEGRFGSRDLSIVHSNDPHTYINSETLGFDIKKTKPGYMMPGALTGNTKNMDYVLTHEYGHHVDFSKNVHGSNYTAHPLTKDPAFNSSLSTYGKSSLVEAYAETFAEWHYTRGRTQNPAAIAMARYEGWYGSGVTASGLLDTWENGMISLINYGLINCNQISTTENFMSLQLVSTIPVTHNFQVSEDDDSEEDVPSFDNGIGVIDNFEDGPKVIGEINEVEPSQKEIQKATKIMKKVLEELGLNYDEIAEGEG